jgi:hypothetical protein
MKQESSPSPIQITEQLFFEFYKPTYGNSKQPSTSRDIKTKNLKGKIQVPRCRSSIEITEQLVFEFDEPICGNIQQSPTSGASS